MQINMKFIFLLPHIRGDFCQFTTKTVSGRTCQRWDRNYPHQVKFYPTRGNHRNNNCAAAVPNDPNPWCYTKDPNVRWEYCNCSPSAGNRHVSSCSKTITGRNCQYWNQNYPHRPNYSPSPSNNNICANPDQDPKGPWCYTTDPNQRYEHCQPSCAQSVPMAFNGKCGISKIDIQGLEPFSEYDSTGKCKKNCYRFKESQFKEARHLNSSKVMRGVKSYPQELPWQGMLNKIGCGAVIITTTKVLTAAHCFQNHSLNPWHWTVTAGHPKATRQVKQVRRLLLHPLALTSAA